MSPTSPLIKVKVLFVPEREELRSEAPNGKKLCLPLSGGGFTPLELALAALGACACIEVYKLLSIRGGLVKEVGVDVVVEKEKEENLINLSFYIKADRISRREAEEIIKRLLDKYCNVWRVFRKSSGLNITVKLKKG